MKILFAILTSEANGVDLESANLNSTMGDIFQLIFIVVVFVLVLFLAYYTTKILAGAKLGTGKDKNIQIVESRSVGVNGAVQLVKVGNKFFLLGVTKDRITFLTDIDGESIQYMPSAHFNQTLPFDKVLSKYFKKPISPHDEESVSDDKKDEL